MLFRSHTVNHPILAKLSQQDAINEINSGKSYLESLTGHELSVFAYPNGKPGIDYRSEERRVGKECRSRWSPYH